MHFGGGGGGGSHMSGGKLGSSSNIDFSDMQS